MDKTIKATHINGLYMVIVALISFAGGLLLKDPIQKAISPKYANIGGVWKGHEGYLYFCEVSTVRDSFYISIQDDITTGTALIIGRGKLENNSGEFVGQYKIAKLNYEVTVWGVAETAGSDQLGVTIFWDERHEKAPRTYAFTREASSSVETPKDEKK